MSNDPPRSGSRDSEKNLGTAIALVGLMLSGMALLGLMVLVMPQAIGIVIVVAILVLPAALHYLLWGWWVSKIKWDDTEPRDPKSS